MEKRIRRIQVIAFISIGCWTVMFVAWGFVMHRLAGIETRAADRFDKLEEMLEEQFTGQEELIAAGVDLTDRRIGDTNYRIQQVHRVYADLLAEQQKKTLENLYDEESVMARYHEAEGLFKAGKYRQAQSLFAAVARDQPENMEARFYQFYSLFLINRGDRGQYRTVQNGLLQLDRNGYKRPEIQEVLAFISSEEAGITPYKE